eukprot:1156951-Pelagomonas_calceolata.AAC.5
MPLSTVQEARLDTKGTLVLLALEPSKAKRCSACVSAVAFRHVFKTSSKVICVVEQAVVRLVEQVAGKGGQPCVDVTGASSIFAALLSCRQWQDR